jgi:hypothetical protein
MISRICGNHSTQTVFASNTRRGVNILGVENIKKENGFNRYKFFITARGTSE